MTNAEIVELPAALRARLPLDVRLYTIFSERSERPMNELRTMLGASTIGIREAIRRLVELGLIRRELTGNPRTPIRYVVVKPDLILETNVLK